MIINITVIIGIPKYVLLRPNQFIQPKGHSRAECVAPSVGRNARLSEHTVYTLFGKYSVAPFTVKCTEQYSFIISSLHIGILYCFAVSNNRKSWLQGVLWFYQLQKNITCFAKD